MMLFGSETIWTISKFTYENFQRSDVIFSRAVSSIGNSSQWT